MTTSNESERAIAGALFDFLGFLTTRDDPVTLSSRHLSTPAVTLLEAWAAKRGLSLVEADVSGWHARASRDAAKQGERKPFLEALGLSDLGFIEFGGFYTVKEREGDEHSAWLVVMPGGRTFAITGHADDTFDERLARWIVATLNAALAAPPAAPETTQEQKS